MAQNGCVFLKRKYNEQSYTSALSQHMHCSCDEVGWRAKGVRRCLHLVIHSIHSSQPYLQYLIQIQYSFTCLYHCQHSHFIVAAIKILFRVVQTR